jgi:protein SCO1
VDAGGAAPVIRPVLVGGACLVVALGVLLGLGPKTRAMEPVDPAPRELDLVDHHGQPFRLSAHRGQVVLVFFGFTFCPEICPGELAHVAQVLRLLGPDAERVLPLFVSVDPDRDTPDVLAGFAPFFDPRILGLTGSATAVAVAARDFGATFRRSDAITVDPAWYLIDHSTSTYVLDADGRWCDTITSRMPAGEAAARIRRLIPR